MCKRGISCVPALRVRIRHRMHVHVHVHVHVSACMLFVTTVSQRRGRVVPPRHTSGRAHRTSSRALSCGVV